jgi:cephalosporin-C deacetylase-like acetyl esterase
MDSTPVVDYSPAMLSRRTRHALSVVAVCAVVSATGCGTDEGGEPGAAGTSEPTVGSTSRPTRTSEVPSPAPVFSDEDLRARLDELTAYDAATPLGERVVKPAVEAAGGARVTDFAYASLGGGEVTGWLVEPPVAVPAPYAGLVYVHGSETDSDDLLDEAVAMARVGAVSLVIDAPFARPSKSVRAYLESYEAPDLERDMTAQAVVDVRRGYDLLAARPDVDPARLGFVGHSWGASLGADVAAVDDRPVAVVMISPRPSWTGFLATTDASFITTKRRIVGEEAWLAYLTELAPFDALPQIARVATDRLLLQYGRADDVVPPDVAQELVDAIAPDGTAQWFEGAGHAIDDAATAARCAWLSERLGLPAVPAEALAEVGLPDR